MRHALFGLLSLGMVGCLQDGNEDLTLDDLDLQVTTQALQVAASPTDGSFVALDTISTAGSSAIPCDGSALSVTVSVADKGSNKFVTLPAENVTFKCLGASDMDLALVMDTSKSMGYDEAAYASVLAQGVQAMVDGVKKHGARMSFSTFATRVSTYFGITEPPNFSAPLLSAEEFQGYTATLDAVRTANEILAKTYFEETAEEYPDADSFCDTVRGRGIVLYGDGEENDSDDSRGRNIVIDPATGKASWSGYPFMGDGVLPQDVPPMVDNTIVPVVYLKARHRASSEDVGLSLVKATGGRMLNLDNLSKMPDLFAGIADYATGVHKLCLKLPEQSCKNVVVKIDYTMDSAAPNAKGKKATLRFSSQHDLTLPCKHSKSGKVANVLMKLNGAPSNITYNTLDVDKQKTLARNLINWAVPGESRAKVLLLNLTTKTYMDQNCNIPQVENIQGEVQFLEQALSSFDVKSESISVGNTKIVEYLSGPKARQVVWVVGGRTLPDNYQLVRQLLEFQSKGGSVILSGDNVTWSYGGNFQMSPLTRVKHVDSGVRMGSYRIYSGPNIPPATSSYAVSVSATSHPITAGLEGAEFDYFDDIDTVVPSAEGRVLMTARVRRPIGTLSKSIPPKPVVIVMEPGQDGLFGDLCFPPGTPEVCDGLDNDCNGIIDDGLGTTTCGIGVCQNTVDNCLFGIRQDCVPKPNATEEVCDGLDNDCDGQVDEDLSAPPASNAQGVCAGARKVCRGALGWQDDFSTIATYELVEKSCDGLDNDCDGIVDGNLTPPPADKRVGVCVGQTKLCSGVGGWIESDYTDISGYEAEELTCDDLDNDCDGRVDEDCKCAGNLDPSTNCTTCKNHWIDNNDLCGTCPGNWDAASDCNACKIGWDIEQGCSICLSAYTGSNCESCATNALGIYPHCFLPTFYYCYTSQCNKVTSTKQSKCFDNTGAEIGCPGIPGSSDCGVTDYCGQNAQYPGNKHNFVCYGANGEVQSPCDSTADPGEVVFDEQTGLMWQRTMVTQTARKAYEYCDSLSYGGYSDWRVPNFAELLSLVEMAQSTTAIDSTAFPDQNEAVWTPNTIDGGEDQGPLGMIIDFQTGSLDYRETFESRKIKCVRGGPSFPWEGSGDRYFTTGIDEKVVTDAVTGLMWQKNYFSGKTWKQALAYCENSAYGGYSNWHLPNIKELASLINFSRAQPASDFPGMRASRTLPYWTSTTSVYTTTLWNNPTPIPSSDKALVVNFGGISEFYSYPKTTNLNVKIYGMCVRNP